MIRAGSHASSRVHCDTSTIPGIVLTAMVIMVTVMRVVCCLLHVVNQERMAHTAIPPLKLQATAYILVAMTHSPKPPVDA